MKLILYNNFSESNKKYLIFNGNNYSDFTNW